MRRRSKVQLQQQQELLLLLPLIVEKEMQFSQKEPLFLIQKGPATLEGAPIRRRIRTPATPTQSLGGWVLLLCLGWWWVLDYAWASVFGCIFNVSKSP